MGREGYHGGGETGGSGRANDPRHFPPGRGRTQRRAKIIHAEGEYVASEKLAMAAEVIQKQPVAIQLRYLQTLVEIGAEKNTTIVFPLPLDIISSLGHALDRAAGAKNQIGRASCRERV